MKKSHAVVTLIAGLLAVHAAEAGDCSGNACDVAYLTQKNGCMVVVNKSDRKVKFSHGVGHSPEVYPHSEVTVLTLGAMSGGKQCMTSIGKHTINYAD
jgi:hypothetical protein